jgi:CRISPR-associated protein Cas2
MLLVSYDISNDKVRTQFSKFLSKFGFRLQYSVFEIHNSERLLSVLEHEINGNYMKHFTEDDSVIIFNIADDCKKTTYGYAKHEDQSLLFVT